MQKIACNTQECMLCEFSIPEWRQLVALKKQSFRFKRGERIFTEGTDFSGLYCILSGAVKVHQQWGEGKELIIRFAGGKDALGLRAIGGELTSHPVSATALDQTDACFIPSDLLDASLPVNPALTFRLMQFYATELQRAERRMSELAHMEVRGRIAKALVELSRVFGRNDEGYLNISISRQDISAYAGTTYETVFKTFTDWISSGIIDSKGKQIQILQPQFLEKLLHRGTDSSN